MGCGFSEPASVSWGYEDRGRLGVTAPRGGGRPEAPGLRREGSQTSPVVAPEGPRVFTWAEVSRHCSSRSCWIVLQEGGGPPKVFDATGFLDLHPGGRSVLLRSAGKDATQAFREAHAWVKVGTNLPLLGVVR